MSNLVVELISRRNVLPVGALVIQLLEPLKPKFVFGLLVLDFSELLKLVMADLQLSPIHQSSRHVGDSLLGLVRSLKAHKSIGFLHLIYWEELDALDLTKVFKYLMKVLVSAIWIKILDVKVASLLRIFVLDGLTKQFFLPLRCTESRLDVQDFAVAHVFAVQHLDSLVSSGGPILMVIFVFTHVAYESKLAVRVVEGA